MEATLIAEETDLVTGEELLAMGDVGPCELVEGVIVRMSPVKDNHGIVELNVGAELRVFVRRHKLGHVGVGEIGIYTRRRPDTVRAADVLFISHERYNQRSKKRGYLDVAPELVVEILSPSDAWAEVMDKTQEYFAIGVAMVWIVDPSKRRVYVYRSLTNVRHFSESDKLPGDEILPGLDLPVATLFVDL
ncbi:MAG: Uma2 family endonuclease [Chloroflexota bacterium]